MADEAQVAEASEPVLSADSAPAEDNSFKASLPEDLRSHTALEPIQDIENLAKAYVNASQMIGRDKLAIPGDAASPDDWGEVYSRLGRPDSADGYEIDFGAEPDEDLVGWFKSTAHDIGLNGAQAQRFIAAYNDMIGTQGENLQKNMETAQESTVTQLRQEYGAKYEENINNAGALLERFGTEGMGDIVLQDGSRLGDNPDFIRSIVGISDFIVNKVSEDEFLGMEKSSGAMAPDEARSKLLDIENPSGPLWDRTHPQHSEYVRERNRLYQFIYPEQQAAEG